MTEIFDLSGMPGFDSRCDQEHETSMLELQHGISIIAVVDNAGLPFLQAVPALLKQRFLRELIIVDRGCPKELLECLQKVSQDLSTVQVVAHKQQLSYLEAVNLAAKKASGKYLLVVDQHAVLPKDASLRLLLEGLSLQSASWLISADIQAQAARDPLQSLLNPKDATLALLGKKIEYSRPSAYKSESFVSHQLSIRPGCFLLPRKQFWANSGFDAACYNEAGMMDLCLKVHLQGGNVYQLDELKVVLHPTHNMTAKQERKTLLGWIHYYRKHYQNSATKRWLLPLSMLLFMRAVARGASRFFSFNKKKKSAEPTIAELLKRQTLS